jgi:hypothetical protein
MTAGHSGFIRGIFGDMAIDMAFDSVGKEQASPCWATIAALASADGSAAHRTPQSLGHIRASARTMTDAAHLIGMLHGRHPGVIDYAALRAPMGAARDWLNQAAQAFAAERAYLTRLVSVAGPIPSTPGQAETEATVAAQRHALDMLSQSDRNGCAVGAAIAVMLDWLAIRVVLDTAADRFGLDAPACALPDADACRALVGIYATSPAIERALSFGTQQVLAQHRGLWDLIDARASARGDI